MTTLVANAASDLLLDLYGEEVGAHARVAPASHRGSVQPAGSDIGRARASPPHALSYLMHPLVGDRHQADR